MPGKCDLEPPMFSYSVSFGIGVLRDPKHRIEAPGLERKAKAKETFWLHLGGPLLRLLPLGRDSATVGHLQPVLLQGQGLEVDSSLLSSSWLNAMTKSADGFA